MTPGDVLAVFRYWHKVSAAHREADANVTIEFDMTVEEWADEDDLLDWQAFGRAMNKEFDCYFSDAEWREAMEPAGTKTVRQVCELIASKAVVDEICPVTLLGVPCLTAGIFLTIRDNLARSGVDVSNLHPSRPLGPFLRLHWQELLRSIVKLAPTNVPIARIDRPLQRWSSRLFGSCLLVLLASGFLKNPALSVSAAILGFFAYLGIWLGAAIPPRSVKLGELKDFRDLTHVILNERASV